MHHKALTKIILLNKIILCVETTKSLNNYFIVITYNHSTLTFEL